MPTTSTPARPATAKRPTDHKPKATRPAPQVPEALADAAPLPVAERTADSFTVEYAGGTLLIDADALNDYELIEELAGGAVDDVTAVPSLLRRLLGPDQVLTLKDLVRNDAGRVPLETDDDTPSIGEFVERLFATMQEIAPS